MCGICGYCQPNQTQISIISHMNRTIGHRGPDDSGELYLSSRNDFQIGMGQTRLSIIDLSAGGHQPMIYKHLSIVFNGEIYNYAEIKEELLELGHEFRSNSDTEVILHAFDKWGLKCVDRFIGMFAFAIYDSLQNKLFCCRDRAGSKPFYYYFKNRTFIFGSELKVFHVHPNFKKEINRNSVELFFRYGYVPAPHTIFNDTYKLEAGKWLVYDLKDCTLEITKYWNLNEFYSKPKIKIDYSDAKAELKKIIVSACNYRMIADVPVGIFLSGGFDSSLVAAVVSESSAVPLKSFTIGFEEGNNEAPFAKETANFLGTEHIEYYCREKDAADIIYDLPFIFDEPFADSSAIPTILVSKLAVKEVKVALSADAGDEVFIGYNRYTTLLKNEKQVGDIPSSTRKILSTLLNQGNRLVPDHKMFLKHRLDVISNTLVQDKKYDALNLLNGAIITPPRLLTKLLKSQTQNFKNPFGLESFDSILDPYDAALAFDYKLYLQNDILTKVDKAAMSVSLEGREPLLDHRIAEFAAQLPTNYKHDGRTSKKILKDIVFDYLPSEMMQRPKSGFSIPINKWLKSSMSGLIDEVIDIEEIKNQGILNPDFVKEMIDQFKSNNFFYELLIWEVIQFQMWYKRWMK